MIRLQPHTLALPLLIATVLVGQGSARNYTVGVLLDWKAHGSVLGPVIEMAVMDVRQQGLLPEGVQLEWVWNDDACAESPELQPMYAGTQLEAQFECDAYIGPSCTSSDVILPLSASALYHGAPIFVYASNLLLNSASYPNLVRTNRPVGLVQDALLALTRTFDWKRLVLLVDDTSSIWTDLYQLFETVLTSNNITCYKISFDPGTSEDSWTDSVAESLEHSLYRVVVIFSDCSNAQLLFADFLDWNLLNGYAYILISDHDGCYTQSLNDQLILQALNASQYALLLDANSMGSELKYNLFRERIYAQFEEFDQYLTPPAGSASLASPMSDYRSPYDKVVYQLNATQVYSANSDTFEAAAFLYDSIMLYARALSHTLLEGTGSNYTAVVDALSEVVPFESITNTVNFEDQYGVRLLPIQVSQLLFLDSSESLSISVIAEVNSSNVIWYTDPSSLTWPGNSTNVPKDYVKYCDYTALECQISSCNEKTLHFAVTCDYDKNCTVKSNSSPEPEYIHCDFVPTFSIPGNTAMYISASIFLLCGILLLAVWLHSVRRNQSLHHRYYEIAKLGVAIITSLAPISKIGMRTVSAVCVVQIVWLSFLPAFILYTMMLDKILGASYLIGHIKPGAEYGASKSLKWVALLNFPLLIILFIASFYDPPRAIGRDYMFDGQVFVHLHTYRCTTAASALLYVAESYMAAVVIGGLWFTSKTLGAFSFATSFWSPHGTTNSGDLKLAGVALGLQSTVLLTSISLNAIYSTSDRSPINDLYNSCALAVTAGICMSIIWLPKIFHGNDSSSGARDSTVEKLPIWTPGLSFKIHIPFRASMVEGSDTPSTHRASTFTLADEQSEENALMQVLSTHSGRKAMLKFARQEWNSVESVQFLLAIADTRKFWKDNENSTDEKDRSILGTLLDSLYRIYIREGSARQVNINPKTAKAVRAAHRTRCIEGEPVLGEWATMLDWVLPAEKEVLQCVMREAWPRFKASDEYKNLRQNHTKRTSRTFHPRDLSPIRKQKSEDETKAFFKLPTDNDMSNPGSVKDAVPTAAIV